ncbi:cytochrome b/b6 domain-containing protein [Microbacterium sp. 2FI]|uniref:cytochrome b/b6 domain-containing protein n=1 Tax=Microbacterium sp. 2FI TaxID=2502193 RepID=UPI0010F50250|nr:cytochrome b/b6 domain-containing protein [Microbacterium sp. 2FI]
MATYGTAIRRGLPRVAGGEAWPAGGDAPVDVAAVVAETGEVAEAARTTAAEAVAASAAAPAGFGAPSVHDTPQHADAVAVETPQTPEMTVAAAAAAPSVRRGLPRVAGGEPWPPADFVPAAAATTTATDAAASATADATAPVADTSPAVGTAALASVRPTVDVSTPLPFTPTVWPGKAAFTRPERRPDPVRIGPFTKLQWAGAVIIGGGGLLYAGLLLVVAVRWFLSLDFMVDFLATYPGEYHLPEGAPVGFPAWLGWQHFFNVFLMVLIIRSGLQVRTEKRPSVFWSPRNNGKRKISLNLWFHQSLDILWLVNGAIFVVLLFATGQWMRIVPTSWEVFPNALSSALQYVSLDWPTENGWVNYNSLQQLAYFTTVFIAAPLAAITGVRMSGIWPKNATGLNKAYPVEWARAVHFPVMLYFCLFIFVHVVLVFATGALRNLNHMYAAQGSTDPDAYAMNWTGFWIFAVSMLVIAGAWVAARPLVLAPIARLFGKVSGR